MNLTLPPDLNDSLKNIRSYQTRFQSFFFPKHYQEKVSGVAKSLAGFLKKNIPDSPADARLFPVAKTVRSFRKDFGSQVVDSHQLRRLARMEFAFLLAISPKALKNPINKGFLKYVQKSRIDCALAVFGHQLKVDPAGEILILHQNKYVRWREISSHAEQLLKKRAETPSLPWVYGEEGLMKEHTDLYCWESPRPLRNFGPTPPWGKNNYLDICIYALTNSFVGNHTWFHIRTEDGKLYSFSLVREPNLRTLAVLDGYIISPDNSDWWVNYPHKIYKIAISTIQKNKALNYLKEKKRSGCLKFQNLESNCTNFLLDLLEAIEIDPPKCKVNIWSHILPVSVIDHAADISTTVAPYIPQIVQKIITSWMTITSNIIMFAFNPLGYSKKVATQGYFASPHDVYKKYPNMTSPFYLEKTLKKSGFIELDYTKALRPEGYTSNEPSSRCPPPCPPRLSHNTTRTSGDD